MSEIEKRVSAVRAFNRFYTNVLGLLRGGLLETPYSLTEARVIFELAEREATEVVALRRSLDIDSGYLSRILARFESDGLTAKESSAADRRRQVIRLTERGRAAFDTLDARSAEQVRELLSRFPQEDQRRMVAAMSTIQRILAAAPGSPAIVLRPLGPGDLGWVVHRHGVIYADEFDWDKTFEALVARVAADYAAGHDPRRENAWVAEVDGQPAGCVFCVRKDETTAQLRLLLVEPRFRGAGVGGRLVEECLRFAARAGYRRIVLWTNDVLIDARRLYKRAGFELVESEPHRSFGHDLIGQNWSRSL